MPGFLFLLLFFVVATPLLADDEPFDLDTVVVTATRFEQDLQSLSPSVMVISREEIERSLADDIAELLRFRAGLELGRNGGIGQTTSFFIRGAESDHTLVLVNGVRMNPGTVGLAQLQNILPSQVERIEIVKGPKATLYGTDAIGGVINIITRNFTHEKNTLKTSLRRGADNMTSYAVEASVEGKNKGVAVAATQLDSDGYPARTLSALDTGYDNTSISLRGHLNLKSTELSIDFYQNAGNAEYLESIFFFGTPPDELFRLRSQDYKDQLLVVNKIDDVTENWQSQLTLARHQSEINQNQANFTGSPLDFSQTDRLTMEWVHRLTLSNNQNLLIGVQGQSEEIDSSVFGTSYTERLDLYEAFFEHLIEKGRQRLISGLRYSNHEIFGIENTWSLDYSYQLGTNTRLFAALGTGYRAPTSSELFGFGGSTALQAERSRSYELGLRQSLSATQALTLNVFDNRIDNLIDFNFDPVTFAGGNENIARTHTRGFEIGHLVSIGNLRINNNAVIQSPKNKVTDGELPRRARQSFTSNVTYDWSNTQLGLNLLASGKRKDSNFSDIVNSGFAIASLSAATQLTEQARVALRLENIFDRDYETAAGFASPGRALFAEFSYNFNPR